MGRCSACGNITTPVQPRYGALGFVAMPNVWIFQIPFPLVSPIMDLVLLFTFLYRIGKAAAAFGLSMTNLNRSFCTTLIPDNRWLSLVLFFLKRATLLVDLPQRFVTPG
jgi:hypothetical protein